MTRFDKYILSQLIMLFGFFALVLVMVYWINRAVVLFDQLIANGQSAGVFMEFSALTLPNVVRIVLPIAAFAASLYVANRLVSESEMVVVQASGFSPYRLARAVVFFGVLVAVLVSFLSHYLVPLSLSRLSARQAEISENITARLLTEGQFLHPTEGVTFYIREITPEGELRDIFLHDTRNTDEHVTYTARQSLLIRHETGPKLVMFDGLVQALTVEDQRLATTKFEDFAYDIAGLIETHDPTVRGVKELGTLELLRPTPELMREVGATRSEMLYEGHARTNQGLLGLVAALIGFSTMLLGGFSRFGMWRQIIGAIVALIVLKSVDNALADVARSDNGLWFLTYGATVLGLAITMLLLWVSARPNLFKRKTGGVPA